MNCELGTIWEEAVVDCSITLPFALGNQVISRNTVRIANLQASNGTKDALDMNECHQLFWHSV